LDLVFATVISFLTFLTPSISLAYSVVSGHGDPFIPAFYKFNIRAMFLKLIITSPIILIYKNN